MSNYTDSMNVRFTQRMIDSIDDWRGNRIPIMSRSKAIRKLIDMALMFEG